MPVQLALLFLASYVLPLQAYMLQQPEAGANNFHQYSNMYLAPFDMGATYAPFVFRQFGAALVHLVCAALLAGELLAGEGRTGRSAELPACAYCSGTRISRLPTWLAADTTP